MYGGIIQATHSTFFRIDLFDITDQVALPPVFYSLGFSYTFNNLIPGHHYEAKVRASSCQYGPWGDSIEIEFFTPDIIIDDVAQNSCGQLGNSNLVYGEEIINLSISGPNQPVEVVRVLVEDLTLQNSSEFILWAQCDQKLQVISVST